jgi:hypothetical protein
LQAVQDGFQAELETVLAGRGRVGGLPCLGVGPRAWELHRDLHCSRNGVSGLLVLVAALTAQPRPPRGLGSHTKGHTDHECEDRPVGVVGGGAG